VRVLDRAVPTVSGDRPGPDSPTYGWPAQLFVAVESVAVDQYVYDDYTATWDDPENDYLWDDPAVVTSERLDATCDLHGIEIDRPAPDPGGQLGACSAVFTLDNRSGRWSQYDSSGRLVNFLPGRAVDVWAEIDAEPWWLFSGQITSWRENPDGTVEVEAFDALTRLQIELGEWTPGVAGDTPAQRLTAICAAAGFTGPTRFATGDVTLLAVETDETPLEAGHHVAESDGGILGCDADGTLTYWNRAWRAGRSDQTSIPVVSDNVCDTVDATAWDVELVTDDDPIVNWVRLANQATPTPIAVEAKDQVSINVYGPETLPAARTEDLWETAIQGQALADYLVGRLSVAYLRVEQLTFHLIDPRQDLWLLAIDRRRGDILEFIHEQTTTTGAALLDLLLIVAGIRYDITPTRWVATLTTTQVISNRIVEHWDQTLYTWDDPDPQNRWGY
jgi:hypothetical protein